MEKNIRYNTVYHSTLNPNNISDFILQQKNITYRVYDKIIKESLMNMNKN